MRAGSKGQSSRKLRAGTVFGVGPARSQQPDIDVYTLTVSAAPPCWPKNFETHKFDLRCNHGRIQAASKLWPLQLCDVFVFVLLCIMDYQNHG
jgi:hypothetical protein